MLISYHLFVLVDGIFMLAVGSAASVVGFGYTYLQAKRAEINEITSKETPKVNAKLS